MRSWLWVVSIIFFSGVQPAGRSRIAQHQAGGRQPKEIASVTRSWVLVETSGVRGVCISSVAGPVWAAAAAECN
jgi:hypothetical protein